MGANGSKQSTNDPVVLREALPEDIFALQISDRLMSKLAQKNNDVSQSRKSGNEPKVWIDEHRKYRRDELAELERIDQLQRALLQEFPQTTKWESPCNELEQLVVKCYIDNAKKSLHCSEEVNAFLNCVENTKKDVHRSKILTPQL